MNHKKLHAVADHVICYMDVEARFLNVIKLQKLLFLIQAWHMAFFNGEELFEEPFEAWVHGPVNRVIHQRFNHLKSNLFSPLGPEDLYFGTLEAHRRALAPAELEHIDLVLDAYGDYSAYQLERILKEQSPWLDARGRLDPEEKGSGPISRDLVHHYFARLANQVSQ